MGFEHISDSWGKTSVLEGGAAESGALDAGLVQIVEAWPILRPQIRQVLVSLVETESALAEERS